MMLQPIDAAQHGIAMGKRCLYGLRVFRQFSPLSINFGLQGTVTLRQLQEFRVHS